MVREKEESRQRHEHLDLIVLASWQADVTGWLTKRKFESGLNVMKNHSGIKILAQDETHGFKCQNYSCNREF